MSMLAPATEAVRTWLEAAATHGPAAAQQLAQNHPYQVAWYAANAGAIMVMGPGGLIAVPLRLIGFGPLGPIAGTLAPWYQATRFGGLVPAGSLFAWLQALGMTVGL